MFSLIISDNLAFSSMRLSFGRFTTERDVDIAISDINRAITTLRG